MATDSMQLDRLERMMHDTLEQQKEMRSEVRDVHDRLVRLEAKDVSTDLSLLQARIQILEADLHRRQGAFSLGTLLPQITGWVMAVGAVLYTYFSKDN